MSAALDTIQWTEALAAAHAVSPPEFIIALGLLSFAGLANLLATLLHSAADAAPLDYTIVRTPLDRFEPARSLGFNFQGHFLQPDGHPRIHYLDEGRPDASYALLLLHGEPFWSQAWQKVVPPLAREARVVVPDMVGFGLSDKWVDWRQYSLARHADSLLQLVDRLGLGRPPGQQVVLVGHNWGWMVGAEMARQRPDLFHRLVILNTNNLPDGEAALGRFSSTATWARFQVLNAWFLAFRAAMDLLRTHFPLKLLMHSLNVKYTKAEVAAFTAPWPDVAHCGGTTAFPLMVPVRPSHPEAAGMAAIRRFLASWTKPTLVLYSEASLFPFLQKGDFVVGNRPEFYRLLVPGAAGRLVRISGSGHLVQWDQPIEVVRHIRAFLHS